MIKFKMICIFYFSIITAIQIYRYKDIFIFLCSCFAVKSVYSYLFYWLIVSILACLVFYINNYFFALSKLFWQYKVSTSIKQTKIFLQQQTFPVKYHTSAFLQSFKEEPISTITEIFNFFTIRKGRFLKSLKSKVEVPFQYNAKHKYHPRLLQEANRKWYSKNETINSELRNPLPSPTSPLQTETR